MILTNSRPETVSCNEARAHSGAYGIRLRSARSGIFIAVVFAMVALISTACLAQFKSVFDYEGYEDPQVFYGALTAGVNFTQVDGDLRSGYHKVGMWAGPAVYVRWRGPWFASMELLFSQKGTKDRAIRDNPSTGPGVAEYDLKLNYMEVPITVWFRYKPRWTIGGGFTYARLMSSKEYAWDNGTLNLYEDINYFHKDDWLWHAALNFEVYPAWVLSMKFSYSVKTIRDPLRIPVGFGGGGQSYAQYNNVYGIRLCYFIQQKKKY